MVSLWGSKNGDYRTQSGSTTPQDTEQGDGGDSSSSYPRQQRRHQREPDERTRLIPSQHSGYLDPDDPQVCIRSRHPSPSSPTLT
jgi:hypothetical protein